MVFIVDERCHCACTWITLCGILILMIPLVIDTCHAWKLELSYTKSFDDIVTDVTFTL